MTRHKAYTKIPFAALFFAATLISPALHALNIPDYRFHTMPETSYYGGIHSIAKDSGGRQWFSGYDALCTYNGTSFVRMTDLVTNLLPNSYWSYGQVITDNRKGLYVGTNQGLLRFNYRKLEFEFVLEGNIGSVTANNDGTVWLIRNNGIESFSPERLPAVTRYPMPPEMSAPGRTLTLVCTKEYVYAASGGDLYRLNRETGQYVLFASVGGGSCVIRDVVECNGSVYVLTLMDGLYECDGNGRIGRYFRLPLEYEKSAGAKELHLYSQGIILVATQSGLLLLDPLTASTQLLRSDLHYPYSLPNNSVWSIFPDPDGGRPRPVPTDETFTLGADTLIVSIGQRVKAGFLPGAMTLKADPHTSQTSLPNVFAGGDAVRGAATLINAVADGRHAAETILARLGLSAQAATATPSDERRPDLDGLRIRQATRVMGPALPERSPEDRLDFDPAIRTLTEEEAMDESRRCLQCDLVCNVCTTVCPNRANVALLSLPMPHPVQVAVRDGDGVRVETLSNRRLEQSYQIVNIADACNECGNCATFCPSAGAPYRDKPRIHLSRESFDNAPDGYRLASPSRLEGKRGGKAFSLAAEKDGFVFESDALIAHLDGGTLCATKVTLNGGVNEAALSGAVEAATLFRLLARKQPFAGPKHK